MCVSAIVRRPIVGFGCYLRRSSYVLRSVIINLNENHKHRALQHLANCLEEDPSRARVPLAAIHLPNFPNPCILRRTEFDNLEAATRRTLQCHALLEWIVSRGQSVIQGPAVPDAPLYCCLPARVLPPLNPDQYLQNGHGSDVHLDAVLVPSGNTPGLKSTCSIPTGPRSRLQFSPQGRPLLGHSCRGAEAKAGEIVRRKKRRRRRRRVTSTASAAFRLIKGCRGPEAP
jgi:hypothetical protein